MGEDAQRKLDAPELHNLEAKVTIHKGGRKLFEMIEDVPDPFESIYPGSSASMITKKEETRLKAWVEMHDLDRDETNRTEAAENLIRYLKREVESEGGQLSILKQEEVLLSHGLEVEDNRAGIVEAVSRNLVIPPPFHPGVLENLTIQNNTLNPLVGAMEINVAATGWTLEPADTLQMEEQVEQDMDGLSPDQVEETQSTFRRVKEAAEKEFQEEVDRQREGLEGFFREPWPGMSFTTLRRRLRRDLEKTGNSYMEILRNVGGEIVFARRIDPKLMRMIRLDEPVVVEKEIERGGEKITVTMAIRERRFVEQVGGGSVSGRFRAAAGANQREIDPNASASALGPSTVGTNFAGTGVRIIYFKEFGASRDLNMWTGQWAVDGEILPQINKATEIIHGMVNEDPRTPYGLPRWINEMPAVIGSRKAEEFNLAFFDAGGIPPLLITVAGGQMSEKAHKALDDKFNTTNPASKHQAIILEVTGTGRMDKQNKVSIGVERFGSERTQDSLFQKYDERTSDLVRMSFRLPPLFLGDAEAHNFATAKASYLVAEAQVFQPERDEDDESINMKLMRNMPNGENFRFKSLPLVIDDAEQQVKCIEIAADKALVGGDQIVEALNKVCGLSLRFDQEASDAAREERMAMKATMAEAFARGNTQEDEGAEERREKEGGSEEFEEIQRIAKRGEDMLLSKMDGLVALGIDIADAMDAGISTARGRDEMRKNVRLYEGLSKRQQEVVDRIMGLRAFGEDSDGIREMFGCAAAIMASNAEQPDTEV